MSFRISQPLRFEVSLLCKPIDREIGRVLQAFERRGDAMRTLNRRGEVVWKATSQLRKELAGMERELEAEFEFDH